jgi:hypothetical protein
VRSAAYRAHERLRPRLGRRAGGADPAGADLCAERSVDDVTFGDSDRLLRFDFDITALSFNLNITALSARSSLLLASPWHISFARVAMRVRCPRMGAVDNGGGDGAGSRRVTPQLLGSPSK